MSWIQAIAYGLIQGLTEFLPVSSSAHLVLLPWLTGWTDPGLAFDVALHWGTLLAVLFYFRRDVADLTKRLFLPDRKLPLQIIAATVPGAIIGLLLEKQAETLFRSPLLIAATLSSIGILLYMADKRKQETVALLNMPWSSAILIGISQGLAIVPGVSRSGITIAVALLLCLRRPDAIRFSFYLSMPIIFGAGLLKFKHMLEALSEPTAILAFLVSAASGYFAIHLLVSLMKNRTLTPFVVYRLLLAGIILAVSFA